ncbi:MAG: DUF4340 domain-containing protein [Deltaproteobacteria bacterium]|nr:DUF4340 domain-containing protein [Deltaproteobacteria bacterium]
MMRLKKEPILLAVVIAGLIIYLMMRDRDRTNYELPDIGEIPLAEISGIEISGAGGNITLIRKGDGWLIDPQGFPADVEKVREMLEIIKWPVLAAMVSESESYARYGLDKDRKIIVKAFRDGTQERVFEIGDSTDDKRRTFVRIGDDHRVFQSLDNIRSVFETETDDLRDKDVLSFDKEEITGITIAKGEQFFKLTLNELPHEKNTEGDSVQSEEVNKIWQDSEGRGVDDSGVENLLYRLSGLSCKRYLYDVSREAMGNPLCVVSLTGEKEYTLSLFSGTDEDKEIYTAVSSENDYPFVMATADADNILNAGDNLILED